jgi:hypothetical protein
MYRIEFSIQRADGDGSGDYEEIGFGSSFSHASLDAALYDVESFIQNRQWESTGDMPESETVDSRVAS